ncbi:MAG: AMP-binding protein [Caldilineaceae bacterium]
MPGDEWQAISLNYTSGTTGTPKGVVYHHRGATSKLAVNNIVARHGQAPGLPLDAAHVPLQRLVLPVDAGRGRGDQRLSAPGGHGGRLQRHRPRRRDPFTAARLSSTTC